MPPLTEALAVAAPMPLRPMLWVSDFACIVDHALAERDAGRGPLTERLGLAGAEIASLRDTWLPWADLPDLALPAPERTPDQASIMTLTLWRGGSHAPEARWLAGILARRALEPRHLWEDMGLASRRALSQLIEHHLPGLAAANRQNMRWKKFFYRQICADTGYAICPTPSCEGCDERDACFAPDAADA